MTSTANLPTDSRSPRADAAQLARLGACMFGVANSFYLTMASAPAHFATLGGETAAGSATTVSTFATVAASLVAPRLVAFAGRRLIFAIATVALGLPCFALLGHSLALAEWACAVRGTGLGLIFIAAGGLAAELAPPSRRGEVLGIYGLAFSLPAIFAVPLGLWLLTHLGPVGLALIACTCALLPLFGLSAFLSVAKQSCRSPAWRLPWPVLFWPIIVQTAGAAALGAMITAFASAVGSGIATTVALAMFLNGLTTCLTRWWGGKLGDRHGHRGPIVFGSALSIIALLLLGFGHGAMTLALCAAALGAGFGLQQNTLTLMLVRSAAREIDGVNAAWNIAYDGGMGIGALAYGYLAASIGQALAIAVVAIVIALTVLIIFWCFERCAPTQFSPQVGS